MSGVTLNEVRGSPRMNFLEALPAEGGVRVPGLGELAIPTALRLPARVRVGLRPEHLRLVVGEAVTFELLEHLGGTSYLHLLTRDGQRLIAEARDMRTGRPGARHGIAVDPAKAYFFDPDTGLRLR